MIAHTNILHSSTRHISVLFLLLFVFVIASCGSKSKDDTDSLDRVEEVLVVNEVMASNRTGIMADDGKFYDWIEVKNVSNETLSLSDYSLVVLKSQKSKKEKAKKPTDEKKDKELNEDKEGKKEKEKKDKKKKSKEDDPYEIIDWTFPEIELAPGGVILVYASKRDEAMVGKELHANFRISSDGDRIQIRKGRGSLVTETHYPALSADQCWRREVDGSYQLSFEQTPGCDNDAKGYEAYNERIDKQRSKAALLLWEVHAKGAKVRVDKKTSTRKGGWIEVKNVSDKPLNLKDYCLSTKLEEPKKWNFPEKTLKPGEIYVVESYRNRFKIGGSETVLLTKDGKFVDGVCTKAAAFGVSVGRKEGKAGFFYYRDQTRGRENDRQARRFIAPMPTLLKEPGIYDDAQSLSVSINTHGRKVHYTTDGSAPSLSSPLYKKPIEIKKSTVIRAYAEGDDNNMRSNVQTGTYFLGEKRKMAVMNVSIRPGDLFDRREGMYMPGPGASDDHPHYGANYWKDITKPAHVEFYDADGGSFSIDCGLAIFGGYSRSEPKKSFKLKFKDIYGPTELKYDVFDKDEILTLKNMVLRSGSQDIYGVMARDEFFTSYIHEACPELIIQDYRPIALYINAEYFGLYYIREKIDKHFVARHLGGSNDSVRIVMAGKYHEEGSDKEWKQLMSHMSSSNIAEAGAYKYVTDRMDVLGIADQNIAQIYACNMDMGNVRYIYSSDPQSDRKWHVVYYDIDASWSATPPVAYFLRTSGVDDARFDGSNNFIVNTLLRNKDFRTLYLERLSEHLHTTFEPKRITNAFDAIMAEIRPEIPHNAERWPKVLPVDRWEKNVAAFRARFEQRPKVMYEGMRKELRITPEEEKKYFSDLQWK